MIIIESEDSLIIENRDTSFARFCLICLFALLVFGLVQYARDPRFIKKESFIGCLGGMALFAFSYVMVREHGIFVIDRKNRVIDWTRKRVLSQRTGTIAFESIRAVVIQTPIGDEGIPSRRVTILTDAGEVPLSVAYKPDHDDECISIANKIREYVYGVVAAAPTSDPASDKVLLDSVRAALDAGRGIEAIRLVRQAKNLSLEDAKRFVDEVDKTP